VKYGTDNNKLRSYLMLNVNRARNVDSSSTECEFFDPLSLFGIVKMFRKSFGGGFKNSQSFSK